MSIFGFGKEKTPPLKVPREVNALRNKIESEQRENFPNAARYEEILSEAKLVYKMLDPLIAKKEYIDEASRLRDDIRNRIARLAEKIDRNRKEVARQDKDDYLERNIDYLQRKSVRNNVKTLFTEFLEQMASLKRVISGERTKQDKSEDGITADLVKIILALHENFFKPHGSDKEIQGMRNELLKNLSDLNPLLNSRLTELTQDGVKSYAALNIEKIMALAKDIAAST